MTRRCPVRKATTVSCGGGPAVSSTIACRSGTTRTDVAGSAPRVEGRPPQAARPSASQLARLASRRDIAVISSPNARSVLPSRRCPAHPAAPWLALLLVALLPAPLAGQAWNTPEALALVRRAVDHRAEVQSRAMLRSYRTRAHGFVFFLAQVGEGLAEPPRLVKADELDVEVYWQAPDRSKQVISGWRDGAFLPTDINYHRDHLGIVTNNFGNVIRIGEGDEVRDVPHPLSPVGLASYDYALSDSAAIRSASGEVTVYQIQVRPRSFD